MLRPTLIQINQITTTSMEVSKKVVIKTEEVIMVFLQYLKEHGLIKSMIALESETNVKLAQYGKEITFFRQLILDGQWEDAENFLNPLKIRQHFNYNRAIFELKRQQFLEDIECCHSDELDIVGLLARAKDLQDKCSKEEFNSLCSYLTLPNLRDHPDFKDWSIEKGRMSCFENILELFKTIYPVESCEKKIKEGRLLELLKQAIQFQCIVQGELGDVGILQDSCTAEKQRKVLENTMGEYKLNIREDNKKNKKRDDVSESTATVYFAQPREYQLGPRTQVKRPTTAHSINFRETFRADQTMGRRPPSPPKVAAKEEQDYEEETKELVEGGDEKEEVEEVGYEEQESDSEEEKAVAESKPYVVQEEERKQVKVDVAKMAQRAIIFDKQPIRTCCFSPEGELLAIGTNSMTLRICSLKDVVYSLDDKYQCQLEGPLELPIVLEQRKYHSGSIYSVDWSHTGRLIATGSNDKTINLLISPFSDPSNTNKVPFLCFHRLE
eukprot:TRINITY_DN71019_c1_g1_i1.p1 TRINITY_DN71019_c1_g1~~TRINITY_DN71019_c1_g1_i1.p1  ORF type:complete len:497 (+),score=67.21 TRINITY_DN71019_c1_g1_i1:1903-3393(+)